MNLVKTSVLTAIGTGIRFLSGLVINKFIAMYIGPAGMGIIGNFRGFVESVLFIANGSIHQGIVKYIAEYQEDEAEKQKILSTSLKIMIVCSIAVGLVVFFFRNKISDLVLENRDFNSVLVVLSFTIVLFALNTLLMSLLNGLKEIKKYVLINIISSLFSLVFSSLLIYKFQLFGALLALATNQSVIFLVTTIFVARAKWFSIKLFVAKFDKGYLKKLSGFALMGLLQASAEPLTKIFIRSYTSDALTPEDAGLLEGMWQLSVYYLLMISTSLSVYYLPRLSEINNGKELWSEIKSGYKTIIPIVMVISGIIFLLKDFIIRVLFDESFAGMSELFLFQLIGDVIKIASWLLAFLMLAKAMTKLYIITQIIFLGIFILLSVIGINQYELVGVTYAHTITYVLYFITVSIIFRRMFKKGGFDKK